MARRKKQIPRENLVAFMDLFASGMGCALILMILFVLRMSRVPQQNAEAALEPVLLSLSMKGDAPPRGAGPGRLQLRIRSADGSLEFPLPPGDSAHSAVAGWKVVRASGTPGEDWSAVSRSAVWLAPSLPPRSRWRVAIRLAPFDPIGEAARGPFHALCQALRDDWERYHGGTLARAGFLATVEARSRDYLAFVDELRTARRAWLATEEEARAERWPLARLYEERWRWALDFHGRGVARGAVYPGTDWWTRHVVDDTLHAASFEGALLALIDGADATRGWQERWVREQLALASGGPLALRLTLSAPGSAPRIEEPWRIEELAAAEHLTADGWRQVATIEVDGKGAIEVRPEAAGLVQGGELPPPAATAGTPPASRWAAAWRDVYQLYGVSGREAEELRAYLDARLVALASRQRGDGSFACDDEAYQAPGMTGLVLRAFAARGLAPGTLGSPSGPDLMRGLEYLGDQARRGTLAGTPAVSDAGLYLLGYALDGLHVGALTALPEARRDPARDDLARGLEAVWAAPRQAGLFVQPSRPALGDVNSSAFLMTVLGRIPARFDPRLTEETRSITLGIAGAFVESSGGYDRSLGVHEGDDTSVHRLAGCLLARSMHPETPLAEVPPASLARLTQSWLRAPHIRSPRARYGMAMTSALLERRADMAVLRDRWYRACWEVLRADPGAGDLHEDALAVLTLLSPLPRLLADHGLGGH